MYFFLLSFFLSLILVINFHKNLHPHFCCFHQVFPQHRSVSRIISSAFSSRCSALFTMPLNICCLIEYWTCMTALQEFMENGTKNLTFVQKWNSSNSFSTYAFFHEFSDNPCILRTSNSFCPLLMTFTYLLINILFSLLGSL